VVVTSSCSQRKYQGALADPVLPPVGGGLKRGAEKNG
jgi:hypothetical protein